MFHAIISGRRMLYKYKSLFDMLILKQIRTMGGGHHTLPRSGASPVV